MEEEKALYLNFTCKETMHHRRAWKAPIGSDTSDRMQPLTPHSFDNSPEPTQSVAYIEDNTVYGFNIVRTVISFPLSR